MATDYDAPRVVEEEEITDSLEELNTHRAEKQIPVADEDTDISETFELPEADLTEEELSVRVIPMQSDEFTCTNCFLVYHRNRIAKQTATETICVDCAKELK